METAYIKVDIYDIVNNPAVEEKYPNMVSEIKKQYTGKEEHFLLTDKAYTEWNNYRADNSIEYWRKK
jgi:hypothetical protein